MRKNLKVDDQASSEDIATFAWIFGGNKVHRQAEAFRRPINSPPIRDVERHYERTGMDCPDPYGSSPYSIVNKLRT